MPRALIVCLLAMLGSVACTHQVRPNPLVSRSQTAPLPLRVRYFISPEQKALLDSDSYFALGAAHTWNIHIGEALASSFPKMLGTVFQSVQEASSAEDIADADVLITPRIQHFDVRSGSFVSTLTLAVHVKGGDGAVRLSEVFEGDPKQGKGGDAWMGGAFAGEAALRQSAEFAFQDVLPKIAAKLRDALAATPPKSSVSMR